MSYRDEIDRMAGDLNPELERSLLKFQVSMLTEVEALQWLETSIINAIIYSEDLTGNEEVPVPITKMDTIAMIGSTIKEFALIHDDPINWLVDFATGVYLTAQEVQGNIVNAIPEDANDESI